jgi:hypothetical protein
MSAADQSGISDLGPGLVYAGADAILPLDATVIRMYPPGPKTPFGGEGRMQVRFKRTSKAGRILCIGLFPCMACFSCLFLNCLTETLEMVYEIPRSGIPTRWTISDETQAAREDNLLLGGGDNRRGGGGGAGTLQSKAQSFHAKAATPTNSGSSAGGGPAPMPMSKSAAPPPAPISSSTASHHHRNPAAVGPRLSNPKEAFPPLK